MNQKKLQKLLLERAKKTNRYMAEIIDWYIDVGIRLEKNDKFGYVIVPVIGDNGWTSQAEWEKEKQWLIPYYKEVSISLRNIRLEEENG